MVGIFACIHGVNKDSLKISCMGSQVGQFETQLMRSESLLNAEIFTGNFPLWSPLDSH